MGLQGSRQPQVSQGLGGGAEGGAGGAEGGAGHCRKGGAQTGSRTKRKGWLVQC